MRTTKRYVWSMAKNKKYCPAWIYDCVVADVCSQFLMNRRQIESVSATFAEGLSRKYMEVSVEEMFRASDETLQFLVKVGVNNSIDLLSNFSFFRFYHVSKTQKRSFRGMMSWNVLSDSRRSYNNLSTLRVLRAYYYEQRSGANKIGCLNWRLENQPEVEFLRVLASRA